jgi:hypothetical protein
MVLQGHLDQVDEEVPNKSVKSALIRKQGLTKKRKKLKKNLNLHNMLFKNLLSSFSFILFFHFFATPSPSAKAHLPSGPPPLLN